MQSMQDKKNSLIAQIGQHIFSTGCVACLLLTSTATTPCLSLLFFWGHRHAAQNIAPRKAVIHGRRGGRAIRSYALLLRSSGIPLLSLGRANVMVIVTMACIPYQVDARHKLRLPPYPYGGRIAAVPALYWRVFTKASTPFPRNSSTKFSASFSAL